MQSALIFDEKLVTLQRNFKIMDVRNIIKLLVVLAVTFAMRYVPSEFFGLDGIDVAERRMLAIFAFAALMWITEVLPAWVTSVVVIVVMLLTVTDGGISGIIDSIGEGHIVSYKSVMAAFADPVVMLFLGGFVLAAVASKSELDLKLAKVILKPFGTKPRWVLLGFLLTTAVFSMFVSNTATAAMMITLLAPVLKSLPDDEPGKAALALAIPIGANVGGIGTPIGTPPNAIAMKYLNDPSGLNLGITFGGWMLTMVPLMLAVVLFSWFVLLKAHPFKTDSIKLQLADVSKRATTWQDWVIYCTFVLTIVLWMLDSVTGLNANVVALIPVALFVVFGIFNAKDLQQLDWSVLWMVAGGFALGTGMYDTGLAGDMVRSIPFDAMPALAVILVSGFVCWGLSQFISNSATAALLMPIMAVVGAGLEDKLGLYGGSHTLLVGVALSASFAMALPISTPPNAISYSTGLITTNQMAKVGVIVGVIAYLLAYCVLLVF